jgi:hypothetical protein
LAFLLFIKINSTQSKIRHASVDRRIGISPIPADPKSYLNEHQQLGLNHLNEYGWTTFCVRRLSGGHATTILRNKHNRRLGILSEDGTLRLTEHLKIRNARQEEDNNVKDILESINQIINKSR